MLQVFGISIALLLITFFDISWYSILVKSIVVILLAILFLRICSINLLELTKTFFNKGKNA